MSNTHDGASSREVTVTRTAPGRFRATNTRGGVIEIGSGEDDDFTPVELLLAALAGCSAIDVDILTSRRSEPTTFDVRVTATKVRDAEGNHLADPHVRYRVAFPDGPGGDAARSVLPDAVRRSHDRLCTVSRTIELPTPVTVSIDPG
jgi:putative redox protein